jgi:hypothetical protein
MSDAGLGTSDLCAQRLQRAMELGNAGRAREAADLFDQVIADEAGAVDPVLRGQVAAALYYKGIVLSNSGDPEANPP